MIKHHHFTKDEVKMELAMDHELLRLSWSDTPNWTNHPLFFLLAKEAVSSFSEKKQFKIIIERSVFWTIIIQYFTKELEEFEEQMEKEGVNTKQALLEYMMETLHEIDRTAEQKKRMEEPLQQ
jgi:hypothetical protein